MPDAAHEVCLECICGCGQVEHVQCNCGDARGCRLNHYRVAQRRLQADYASVRQRLDRIAVVLQGP